jgi:hypothetical protein
MQYGIAFTVSSKRLQINSNRMLIKIQITLQSGTKLGSILKVNNPEKWLIKTAIGA